MQQDERRAVAPAVVAPYFAAVNGDHHLGHNVGLSHIVRAQDQSIHIFRIPAAAP
jgi:hypothetical protein